MNQTPPPPEPAPDPAPESPPESPPEDASRANTRRIWLWLLLLAVVGSGVYARSLDAPFIFDDRLHIKDGVNIFRLRLVDRVVQPDRRKFVKMTLAANYAMGGHDTTGYHVTNIAIHVLAGLTLFGVVRRTLLLPRWRERFGESADNLAFAVALLWMVHPLQTAAVAYIIQRAESLMGLCFLLTFYCFVRGVDLPPRHRGRRWWFAGSVVACLIGTGVKDVIFAAPIMLLLFDRTFVAGSFKAIGRRGYVHALVFATLLHLVHGGVLKTVFGPGKAQPAAAVQSAQRANEAGHPANAQDKPGVSDASDTTTTAGGAIDPRTAGLGIRGRSPYTYLLTQSQVIWHYIRLTFWPDPLVLDYGWPLAKSMGEVWLPFFSLALLFAVCVCLFWVRPWLGFMGLWFFVILGPTSSIVPIADAAFEHRMYLPILGVIVPVVFGAYVLIGRRKAVAWCVLALAALSLTVRTAVRVEDYRSERTLWQGVAQARPNNPRGRLNYGATLYADLKDVEGAKTQYLAALRIAPNYVDAMINLGTCYYIQGDHPNARKWYSNALTRKPTDHRALLNMGRIYLRKKNFAQAEEYFQKTFDANRFYQPGLESLGLVLAHQGKFEQAIEVYQVAAANFPNTASFRGNMGAARIALRDYDRAIKDLMEARRLDPKNPTYTFNLGRAYAASGDHEQAAKWFYTTINVKPGQFAAFVQLGVSFTKTGKTAMAVDIFTKALRARPDTTSAMNHLAWLLATDENASIRNGAEALRLAQRADELTGHKDVLTLDTLAAAHAEVGQFDQAAKTADLAVKLGKAAQKAPADLEAIRRRGERYRAGQPHRSQLGARR